MRKTKYTEQGTSSPTWIKVVDLDSTTLTLFSPFQKEIGRYRKRIYSQRDFEVYIIRMNGQEENFISLFSFEGSSVYGTNAVFFDFDGYDAIPTAKRMYREGVERGYGVIPVITGKKGIHLYFLTQYEKCDSFTYRNASRFLLNELLGKDLPKCVDMHVVGNIRQMVRIPNTKRYNLNTWASYLPPYWDKLDFISLLQFELGPNLFEYDISGKRMKMSSLPTVVDEKEKEDVKEDVNVRIDEPILRKVLRPCLYEHITSLNPKHHVRVAVTIELLHLGFTKDAIIDIYSRLGWIDWNREITKYQVGKIINGNYRRYSKRRLGELGVCRNCVCGVVKVDKS